VTVIKIIGNSIAFICLFFYEAGWNAQKHSPCVSKITWAFHNVLFVTHYMMLFKNISFVETSYDKLLTLRNASLNLIIVFLQSQ